MSNWTMRDTMMVLFMVAVVVIMFMQMTQNDRLYDRVSQAIRLMESRGSWGGNANAGGASGGMATSQPAGESGCGVPAAQPGGDVVVCYAAQPSNLNPLTYKDYYAGRILLEDAFVYPTLLERDAATLGFNGVLADSWSIAEDKLHITFKIKPQARWSDGVPVTADDIVFSFRLMMIPTLDTPSAQTYYLDCEKVEAVDAKTARFTWKKKYYKSLETAGEMPILPRHVIDPGGLIDKDPKELAKQVNEWNFLWKGKPQVTCGPYLLESWDRVGNRVVLRRNDNYWDPKPAIQRIVYRFIANDVAGLQAMKNGDVDVMWLTTEEWQNQTNDPKFLENFIKLKYLKLTAGYLYIGWNNRRAPFDDKAVRWAMSYCFPRDTVNEKIFYGLYMPVTGPFCPMGKQADPSVQPVPFDPAKAKALLAEAGFKDTDGDGILDRDGKPFSFSLIMPSGSSQFEQVVALFQDELAKIGVKMNIDPYEWSVFTTKLDDRAFDACILRWGGVVDEDPYQVWHSSSFDNKGSNHIGYVNPEVDRLISEARQEFDVPKRIALYHRIHKLIADDQPYTFLLTGPTLMAHSKRIENVKPTVIGVNFMDWWIPRDRQRAGN